MSRNTSFVCVPKCAILIAGLVIIASGARAEAATWWVDNANPGCSDAGPGTEATPFCTIKPGASHALAGDSVLVKPGTYREQVTTPASGAPGTPINYQATGSGVVILGTLNLSDPAFWTATATTAWSQPYAPPSAPKQVFVDGTLLAPVASQADLTTNSFFYDSIGKILYVDLGGPNPAEGHQVEAGARSYGVLVSGKTGIVVDGFFFRGQNIAGVRGLNASDLTVRGTTTTEAASYGILLDTCAAPLLLQGNTVFKVASSGIKLDTTTGAILDGNTTHHNASNGITLFASSNNTLLKNTSYANLKPLVTSAVGIDLDGGSSDNLLKGNLTHHNDDSGIQLRNGSNRNLMVRNVSYLNGDHGFDTRVASDNRYVSNTSYGNKKDGFSIEGNATGTRLWNNIAVDNGLTTNENDLYVDGTSAASFASDYDLFWNSSPGITVRFNDVSYGTFTGYRTATGFEPNGREGDPRFANAPTGDLHLASISSSAVDSADASTAGFSQEDQEGRLPIDLLTVPDAGAGIPTFADRGAYEYDAPPTATLKLTPSSGAAPLAVTADAVGSSDPDTTGIASYLFSFGDGASVGPQSQSSATHTYTQTGTYTASVKVTDTAGLSSIASGQVVAMDTPPVARLTLTPTSGRVPLPVTANASASTDTDSTPIATYRFDFGDGTIVGPQAGAIATHTYTTTKTFKVTVTVTDTAGFSTSLTKNVMVKK